MFGKDASFMQRKKRVDENEKKEMGGFRKKKWEAAAINHSKNMNVLEKGSEVGFSFQSITAQKKMLVTFHIS